MLPTALAPFVESIHYHKTELPMALERSLPNGRIHLMVNLDEDEFRTYSGPGNAVVNRTRGTILAGPHGKATDIDTREQRCLVSVNFTLGGAAAFFSTPLAETRDQLVELCDLWGRDGRVLRERLLEARTAEQKVRLIETVLLDKIAHTREPDPAMKYAASSLERGIRVSEVCTRLGLLPKTLVRRFRRYVGLTPKRYARIGRLQRMLPAIARGSAIDWSDLAAGYGYTDQAHLIHDFRDLTGLTPTSYQPRSADEHNHVPVY